MLPRLLDNSGFQSAAGLTPDEFANAALSGMVPRAIGVFANNVPLWPEQVVQSFCKEMGREFNTQWCNGDGATASAVNALANAHAVVVPVVPMAEMRERDTMDFPDEMTQAMAARYCECSGAFLDKHRALLNPRKDGGFVIYKKSDLDAFMDLAVYKYRKRFGYSAGKPNGKSMKVHRAPKGIAQPAPTAPVESKLATAQVLLSEKGAADHLGMHPETLAIARHDGIGPACTMMAGRACYRVADLDAWKTQQAQQTPPPPAPVADAVLDTAAAAEFLGVTPHTLQNWRSLKTGPQAVPRDKHARGTRVYYLASVLDEFKRTHATAITRSQKLHANPHVLGAAHPSVRRRSKTQSAAAKKQRINGTAHAAKGRAGTARVHGAGGKSVTPSGSRLRH
jgi:hypothetical protein